VLIAAPTPTALLNKLHRKGENWTRKMIYESEIA
jgi:hypothetical protein